MAALHVLPPKHYIGAVESIPAVISYVEKLQSAGAVYSVDGDLYFRVHADERFGSVAGLTEDRMLEIFAERGGDPDRVGKEHPLDCLLWQLERPGEPAWESPFGRGRPGWHIECTAIALDHLASPLDVQGGGSDLAFPHHEMGASEAQVATGGWPYARHYTHAAMVRLDGEKMSKSRGNLVFVSKLRHARHRSRRPSGSRILAHHYRTDWDWTDAGLDEAVARLAAWRDGRGGAAGRTRRRRALARCAPAWPTTSTPRAPSLRSTGGPRRRACAGAPPVTRTRPPARSCATWPRRCSASASDPTPQRIVPRRSVLLLVVAAELLAHGARAPCRRRSRCPAARSARTAQR